MVSIKERKSRQIRMTYEDTKENVLILIKFLRLKIKYEEKIKDENEAEEFISLFSDVVLSHGSINQKITIPNKGRFNFGTLFNFVHQVVWKSLESDDNYLYLQPSYIDKPIKVDIVFCWKIILKRVMQLHSYVSEETIHMSREATMREETTTHRVSLKEKLKQKERQ